MAPKFVVVALIFFAVVGMASASAPAASADAPADNSVVGTLDGGSTTTAAPVGGPIPSSVYDSLSPAGAPNSAATTAGVSAAATVVVVTVAGSFFF